MLGRFLGALCHPAVGTTINVTTYTGFASATDAGGAAAPTIPTHAGPTGTQKDLIIASQYRNEASTSPGLPTGFTNIDTTAHTSVRQRVSYKWAASGSETFSAANTHSALVWVFRFTNAPTLGFLNANITKKSLGTAGNSIRHAGVTVTGSKIIVTSTCVVANVNASGSTLHRSDTVNQFTVGSGAYRVYAGTSSGLVTSWAQQDTTASGPSETISFALEIVQ
jgi:hypothetical protein